MAWLKGKKTILGSIAGGLTMVAWSLGLIDDATVKVLIGVIATWTGVSIRMAIGNVETSKRQNVETSTPADG